MGSGDELDHVHVVRSKDAGISHRVLEAYAGTETWVLGVDGDELYDPSALGRLRVDLEAGAHADVFRLKSHVLNCDELTRRARVRLPCAPVAACHEAVQLGRRDQLEGLPGAFACGLCVVSGRVRLGGDALPVRLDELGLGPTAAAPRLLPQTLQPRRAGPAAGRPSAWETGAFRRGILGLPARLRFRRNFMDPRIKEYRRDGRNWKREWYARGERITVDASPFFVA